MLTKNEKNWNDELTLKLRELTMLRAGVFSEEYRDICLKFSGRRNAIVINRIEELKEVLLIIKDAADDDRMVYDFDADSGSKANSKFMNKVMSSFRTATPEDIELWDGDKFLGGLVYYSVKRAAWTFEMNAKFEILRLGATKDYFTNFIWMRYRVKSDLQDTAYTVYDLSEVLKPAVAKIDIDAIQEQIKTLRRTISLVETEADRQNLEKAALELFAEEFELAEDLEIVVDQVTEKSEVITEEQKEIVVVLEKPIQQQEEEVVVSTEQKKLPALEFLRLLNKYLSSNYEPELDAERFNELWVKHNSDYRIIATIAFEDTDIEDEVEEFLETLL